MNTMTEISRHGANIPSDAFVELCETYGVRELSVLGSLMRDDSGLESDIDFLVVFGDGDLGP